MFDKKNKKISLPLELAESEDFSLPDALRQNNGQWGGPESEGQLAVDVAQTQDELIVVATIAGTSPDKIELHLHNDLLTIRGERSSPVENAEHFYQECYWGKFSRTIVLPVDIRPEMAAAEYKNGVLTIRLAKSKTYNEIPILIVED